MDQIIQDILCNVKEYLKGLTGSDRFFADKEHQHQMSDITDYSCEHNNDCHTEEYATTEALNDGLSEKSTVNFSPTITNGEKLGEIEIDGNKQYIRHPSTHPATMITDSNAHETIGSSANAQQSIINTKIDTALKNRTVTFSQTLTSSNDTTELGKIKIGTNNAIPLYCKTYTHPNSEGLTSAVNTGMYKISANRQGHITGATRVEQSDITALGIPNNNNATTQNAGLMSARDKKKMDNISQYRMFMTNDNGDITPPSSTIIPIRQHENIYAAVVDVDGIRVENEYVDFILGGQGYSKLLDPENMGFATQKINWTPGWYTITCIYRVNGWTLATDTRALQVT